MSTDTEDSVAVGVGEDNDLGPSQLTFAPRATRLGVDPVFIVRVMEKMGLDLAWPWRSVKPKQTGLTATEFSPRKSTVGY